MQLLPLPRNPPKLSLKRRQGQNGRMGQHPTAGRMAT